MIACSSLDTTNPFFSGSKEEALVFPFSSFFPSLLVRGSTNDGSVSDSSKPKFIFPRPIRKMHTIKNNNSDIQKYCEYKIVPSKRTLILLITSRSLTEGEQSPRVGFFVDYSGVKEYFKHRRYLQS
jgi:hypothetical protein